MFRTIDIMSPMRINPFGRKKEMEEHPAWELFHLHTGMYRILKAAIVPIMRKTGLHMNHWMLLSYVASQPEGVRARDIAHMMSVAPPFITDLTQTLKAKRLIRVVRDPHDARAKRYQITEAGGRLLSELQPSLAERMTNIMSPVSEKDREVYIDILQRLTRTTEM